MIVTRPVVPPLRSVLFVPGSEPAELEAAMTTDADALIIDLEEPRTPFGERQRIEARRIVGAFLAEAAPAGARPLLFCRIQAPRTGRMLADLRAVLSPSLFGIVVPKSVGPEDVVAAEAVLANAEVEAGLEPGRIVLYPILETAPALRRAYDIAMASARVAYLGGAVSRFGDIHQAVGFRWTAEGRETLHLRSAALVDARAAGIRYPISGMWGGPTDDAEGFGRFATELRELGYYGMMLGFAEHVPLAHEVFTPTPGEVAYWTELVRLADAADAELAAGAEVGPILHGDPNQGEAHVVHGAHIGSARLNLEWARALGVA